MHKRNRLSPALHDMMMYDILMVVLLYQ